MRTYGVITLTQGIEEKEINIEHVNSDGKSAQASLRIDSDDDALKATIQVTQQPGIDERHFLQQLMSENLLHARHVETERLTFVSLLLVGIGYSLSTFSPEKPVRTLVIGVLLCLMNLVCSFLLKRWNDIHKAHMSIAEDLVKKLSPDDDPGKNSYYIFDFKLTKSKGYLRTGTLFWCFNILIYALIIVLTVANCTGLF